jgi:hypothetical protein
MNKRPYARNLYYKRRAVPFLRITGGNIYCSHLISGGRVSLPEVANIPNTFAVSAIALHFTVLRVAYMLDNQRLPPKTSLILQLWRNIADLQAYKEIQDMHS